MTVRNVKTGIIAALALLAATATAGPATAGQAGSTALNPVLGSVSCTSSSLCIATGSRQGIHGLERTLAEKWNGSAWTTLSPLSPRSNQDNNLNDISCGSPTVCFAVGTVGNFGLPATLIEMWNGQIWSVLAVGDPKGAHTSRLQTASCAGPSACFAVGDENDNTDVMPTALVEHWNGASWSLQTTPVPAMATAVGMSGVSCVTPADCTAVGGYGLPRGIQKVLVEHYNGTNWTLVPAPSPPASSEPALTKVACSGTDCVALGTTLSAQFGEAFNGHTWSIVPLAKPSSAEFFALDDVTCPSSSDCYAVGSSQTSAGVETSLIEHWNGHTWTVTSSPNVAGATDTTLAGVSCSGVGSCMAVGRYMRGSSELTLAMQLANGTWTILPTRTAA